MFWQALKIIITILFAPVVFSSTKAFLLSFENLKIFTPNSLILISGFLAYPIFHIVFMKPMYVYALGHELVHVLATWLSCGKVASFRISSGGGSVSTTKTNPFITLSPYFVPIHAMFLVLVYWILSLFYDVSKFFNEFIFLIGFAMSFHIFLTIETMKLRQPDIVKTGYIFSVFIIYVANISITLFVLSLIFGEISFPAFAKNTFFISKDIYINTFNNLLAWIRKDA